MDYNLYCFIALLLCCMCVQADPCRRNNGGCDKENGLCWTTGSSTHFCTCKAGYKRSETASSHSCIDIDECWEETPCDQNAVCQNTEGSYICDCLCGYVKDYTGQYCLEASKIKGQCHVPRRCKHDWWWWFGTVPFNTKYAVFGFVSDTSGSTNFVASEREIQKGCDCEEGYSADQSSSCGFCEDIDECATGTHQCRDRLSTCTNTEGSYYCGCRNGYILGPCGRNCFPPSRRVPVFCDAPDLSALAETGPTANRSYVRPILLENYRTCPESVNAGANTIQKVDINLDGKNDVTLTWLCIRRTPRSNSILELFTTRAARWGSWTCWTKCKATCWGGLQTRMRKCFNGLPGTKGCEGPGSQKRSCYEGKRCPYRIRKNVESLSASERDDLRQAMIKYKQDMTVKGFHNAASSHGWPFQCDRQSCCPHQARTKFITWHRTIMLNYEEGLVRHMKNKKLGIPYWNWLGSTADLRVPPKFATDKTVVINGRATENPFYTMEVLIDRTGPNRNIVRDDQRYDRPLTFAWRTYSDTTVRNMRPSSMHEYSEALETAHNGPHVSTCGGGMGGPRCTVSLATLSFAGFDPLFMLHHSQVDRLWAVSQKKMEKETTWTKQTALEIFEDEGDFGRRFMPYANTTINSFPIVQATNTMIDSYYYEELTGVKYDDLGNDGFPIELARERALDIRPAGREALFIAHYLQSVGENVFVNYFATFEEIQCSLMEVEDFAGQTLLLGTDTVFRNAIPRLTLMEGLERRGQDQDFIITPCYTQQPNCTVNCAPFSNPAITSMPNPGLVYWIANTPVDIFKFYWNAGARVPSWQINIAALSQYVFIYGERRGNVYQVPTMDDWNQCRSTNGRPFRCSLQDNGACALPPAVYYLVDENADHCRRGLRMYIVSRF